MKVKSFGISDVGKRREKNEDSFLANQEHMLFAVADGMGGHLGGDIASKLAAETIGEVISSLETDPDMTLQEGGISVKPGEFQSYLRYAIRLASKRIFEKADGDASLRGMGTTTVALLLRNDKAYIANVGDSRVYRIRGNQILQITKDHSLVAEQMRAGILSEKDARVHRFRNIITRSVGFQEDVEADVDIRVVREGDRFVLCSDGLSNMIRDDEIRDVIANTDVEPGCTRLIDIANERGGDDNITVVAVEVVSVEGDGEVCDDEGDDEDESCPDEQTIDI
ncbi:MAG: Stp1/IreP family PP2C-type Ser/Thr phosphatase [Deltaproteobacteria bacterium]|jgi:PPM family protein phosphatase|nr:Stp1/IreP family PP2C-type Ser/Thr phosphatase [Deltaproteobacteria bacterium]